MFAEVGTLGLSFLAGLLSTLSPCVLPLLPILIGSAVTSHRHGPVALALGLGLSFTLAGVALAALGLYGTLSRDVTLLIRGKLMKFGSTGKYVFGALMIAVGASILTGFDRGLEARLVQWSPDRLTDLTTRF